MSHRRLRLAVVGLVASSAAFMNGVVAAPTCWSPPVDAAVADPFREPACRWCPGNRGIEYATRAGRSVRAVATGRVTFAGSVVGVGYLVVEHLDGRRVTYGNVRELRYRRGDLVRRGQSVGTTAGRLHFGVRVGDRYVDPAPFLGRLVGRPRLVPADGSPPAPSPAPLLRCRR